MGAQGFGSVREAGQFGLGRAGVNFVMADLVDEDCWAAFAAPEFRHKVVPTLWRVRRDWAFAERADWMWFGHWAGSGRMSGLMVGLCWIWTRARMRW